MDPPRVLLANSVQQLTQLIATYAPRCLDGNIQGDDNRLGMVEPVLSLAESRSVTRALAVIHASAFDDELPHHATPLTHARRRSWRSSQIVTDYVVALEPITGIDSDALFTQV